MYKKYKTLLGSYGVNTPLRIAHFMGQLEHESGLKPISEDTRYSRNTLLTVFKKYFNESNVDKYLGKGDKILDRTYANRMGNGDESSSDGSRYKGRGFIQITGKDNYRQLSKDTGIDYVKKPELLLEEANAMISALWYWKNINGNKYADLDDIDAISDLINIGRKTPEKYGDSNGFKDRLEKVNKWKNILKA